ncbi:MAG: phosphate/phosphite/phosphonate ABC transporter substrate-binding protein [Caulobacteraceae bacterium]|nr:phosphate/phosphite/phosphonate ABC transporter substrate-binding protein [Caulobacteraceae bacterium]
MKSVRNILAAACLAAGLAACGKAAQDQTAGASGQIVFSILPTAPAAVLQKNWQPLLDDMSKATGLTVKAFIPSNYTTLIEAMRFKQTDVGWFSNETGLQAVRRANGEVFARTRGPNGVDGYQSVLIVNAKAGVTLDKILKCDKSLSFGQADPLSTSGYVAPIAFFFGPHDIQPEKCFRVVRTSTHSANLLAVANGALDVATDNGTALALNRQAGRPEADEVKVVWTSPTLPEDPIIWRKDLDPAIKAKVKAFFLSYAKGDGPEAQRERALMKPLSIGGFVDADDSHLLTVREVEAREQLALARWGGDAAKVGKAQADLNQVLSDEAAHATTAPPPASTAP